VELASPTLSHYWPADRIPGIRTDIQRALIQSLRASRFSHWLLQDSPADSTLLFRVVESIPGTVDLRIEVSRGGAEAASTTSTWLGPGDLIRAGGPVTAEAAMVISGAFLKLLRDTKREAEIGRGFRAAIPIAKGGIWNSGEPEPRLVLPLRWDVFEPLSESSFVLQCEWPNHGSVYLEAEGPHMSASFELPAPGTSYIAVVAVPTMRRYLKVPTKVEPGLYAEILQLKPLLVFLSQPRKGGIDEWTTAGGSGQ
jgi:hypothetical protein